MASTPSLYWPFPESAITERAGTARGHQGTDFGVPTGTHVRATSDGTIVFVGDDGLGGMTIDLRRDDGLIQRYGHLSAYWVKSGQRVSAGNTIALSGNTGNSTGPHLHWELRWDRAWNGGRWIRPETLNPQHFGAPTPAPRKDPDMARILNMRQTNDGKNDTATIFFDGGPGVGIKGISSPAHLVLLQRFIADKPGDHMFPAELAVIQTYLAPGVPTLTAATVEAAVTKAIKASGGSVEAAAVAAAVEATLKDDFAGIPAAVGKKLAS